MRKRATPAPVATPRTFAYTRVSTDRQASEGESLDLQERSVAGYAMMHGMTVERVFCERGVSGSKPLSERPEGAAMIATLRCGDTVITPKLDRMFRSANDALQNLEAMKKAGVHLHMIDLGGDVCGNGIAKLVFTILSAVAEAERDRIRERVSQSKADQKARGRYLGGPRPFGFEIRDGMLIPIDKEQAAIGLMRKLRDEGQTLRDIRDAVNANGFRVTHVSVNHILKR